MQVLLTGGSGVLGRAVAPLLSGAGHTTSAPRRTELDLFDYRQVARALSGVDAVFHLATRIPPREEQGDPDAWRENNRLRRDGTRVLVDVALALGVETLIFPSIAFVYPDSGFVDESTPVAPGSSEIMQAALAAEREIARFAQGSDRVGVVLRLGLLYGPGTGSDTPAERYKSFGATLRIEDAGAALAAALGAPSGIYNVVSDGERVSNSRFKQVTGWRPLHGQEVRDGDVARIS